MVDDVHATIQPALLGEIANVRERSPGPTRTFKIDRNRAGIGRSDTQQHPQGSGLAGSVRSQQSEHGTSFNPEREPVDRRSPVEGLGNSVEYYCSRRRH